MLGVTLWDEYRFENDNTLLVSITTFVVTDYNFCCNYQELLLSTKGSFHMDIMSQTQYLFDPSSR